MLRGAASLAITCAVLAACADERSEVSPPPAHPNVLLITVDTLRADHLGAYGHPDPLSPALDALAVRGVLYERALAASSRTAPSHASILTSRWVRDHSIGPENGSTRLGDEATLATILGEAGYATGAFISNRVLSKRMGLDRGFEVYDDSLPERERNRVVFERTAHRTARRARIWIGGARAPWFAWVHLNDPHGPYTPPAPWDEEPAFGGAARGSAAAVAERALPVLEGERGEGGIPAYQAIEGLSRPSDYRRRYAGEIRHLDEWLGRTLVTAERATGEEGLVIVLTADHGESHGEEGVFFAHGHGTSPAVAHVPLLVVAPGLAPGRSPDLVHHVDVLPTILDLAGLPVPAGAAGVALGALRRAGAAPPARALFTDVGAEVSAYRGQRFERLRDGARESFRWRADGGFAPAPPDPALRAALESYAAKEPARLAADPPSEADLRRLRALGYVLVPQEADAGGGAGPGAAGPTP